MHNIIIEVPDDIYEQLSCYAEKSQHSVEDAILKILSLTTVTDTGDITPELKAEMAKLPTLDDKALLKILKPYSRIKSRRTRLLNYKQQREGLTAEEHLESNMLLRQSNRHMLLRAQALVLLMQRGYNINKLIEDNKPSHDFE